MIDPVLNNFLKVAKALSLDRHHKLTRQLMDYVLCNPEWAQSPDAHIHLANFLEWQALDEDNYFVMLKADLSYRKAIELAPTRADILNDYIMFLINFGKQGDALKFLVFVQEHISKKMVREFRREIRSAQNATDSQSDWLRVGFPGRNPDFRAAASNS